MFRYDYVLMCLNKLLLPERDASETRSIEHATLIVPMYFIVVLLIHDEVRLRNCAVQLEHIRNPASFP